MSCSCLDESHSPPSPSIIGLAWGAGGWGRGAQVGTRGERGEGRGRGGICWEGPRRQATVACPRTTAPPLHKPRNGQSGQGVVRVGQALATVEGCLRLPNAPRSTRVSTCRGSPSSRRWRPVAVWWWWRERTVVGRWKARDVVVWWWWRERTVVGRWKARDVCGSG